MFLELAALTALVTKTFRRNFRMKETRDIMGMPVSVEIADAGAADEALEKAFAYFDYVDRTFSTYKPESEISRINRGDLSLDDAHDDVKLIFKLAEETKRETDGYFDIAKPDGIRDPSGIVKGWVIKQVSDLLASLGFENTYVEAGGDIQTKGKNVKGEEWRLGIRNPLRRDEIVKVIVPRAHGVATSGTYIRGQHIYDPHTKLPVRSPFMSMTVIGPNVYEADRIATAAFAMGEKGVHFLQQLPGFEAYAIDTSGIATMTSSFSQFVC